MNMEKLIRMLRDLPPEVASKFSLLKTVCDHMDSINDDVVKACNLPVTADGAVYLSRLSAETALRAHVIKHVLQSFSSAISLADLTPIPLGLYEPTRGATPMRSLIGMAPDLDAEGILSLLKHRRESIVETLVELVNHLTTKVTKEYNAHMSFQSSIHLGELDSLVEILPAEREAADILFVREEEVRVRDRRAAQVPPQQLAQPVKTQPASNPGQISLVNSRAEALQAQVIELQSALADQEQRKRDDESPGPELRELNRSLRARVRGLEAQVEKARAASKIAATAITLPSSWNDLRAFGDEYLAGRVVLTTKAVRAATSSLYANIPFAFDVLLMLAQDYVPMRRGDEGARERYLTSCARLKVEIGPIGEAPDHHLTRDAYKAVHLGRKVSATLHVQGSSSRDPREGFRLYFTWMEDSGGDGQVVVISFPSHLDNSRS